MAFWDRWLGSQYEANNYTAYGRYSDTQKSATQYDHWDQAIKAFDQDRYVDSYCHVLEFLKDSTSQNLNYEEARGAVSFMFYQGSKVIYGTGDRTKLRAEAKIVRAENMQLPFVKRLIDQNFGLKYCRFAIDKDGDICIVFDTYAVDASPYKLYYAFKELAAKADKHDDLLLYQYESLQEIHSQHILSVPQSIKDVKYNYVRSKIDSLIQLLDNGRLDMHKLPSAFSYLALDLVYRIDYLIRPEGATMELIEFVHNAYFQSNDTDIKVKNQKVIAALRDWLQRPKDRFDEEIYNVISTFGIAMPSGHNKLRECIDNELHSMEWYYDNRHDEVALAVPSYLAGYLLFSYGLPEPDRAMLHLLYEIQEESFFADLGLSSSFYKKGKLNPRSIKQAIGEIEDHFETEYPAFDPEHKLLDYSNMCQFSKTWLIMLSQCDLSRVDPRDQ